jgi:hypothetical protein
MFLRILVKFETACPAGQACPNVLEFDDGDFAIIGSDVTSEVKSHLPPGSGCGPGERIIRVPRSLLIRARPEIPAEV